MADTRKVHAYFGILIHPMATNPMGCRWWAFGPNGLLQADTLAGMRSLIRHYTGRE